MTHTDCVSCRGLRSKVTELESRISVLHSIHEDEKLLDALAAIADSTHAAIHRSPPDSTAASAGTNDDWPALSVNKAPYAASTPNKNWTQAKKKSKRARNSSHIQSPPISLRNSFEALLTIHEEYTTPSAKRHRSSNGVEHEGLGSSSQHTAKLHPGDIQFTPSPSRIANKRFANNTGVISKRVRSDASKGAIPKANSTSNTTRSIVANATSISTEATQGHYANNNSKKGPTATFNRNATDNTSDDVANKNMPQLNTILIGDAMTKHVKLAMTENISLSNTSIEELTSTLPALLNNKPNSTKIVIHTGSFDILHKKTGTEILKTHFTQLLNTLQRFREISISGPIACFRRGKEAFSRLISYNNWLASFCYTRSMRFIDNFNVFWNCADRFQADGLHPNHRGSRLLTANIDHGLISNTKGQIQTPTTVSEMDIQHVDTNNGSPKPQTTLLPTTTTADRLQADGLTANTSHAPLPTAHQGKDTDTTLTHTSQKPSIEMHTQHEENQE